MRPKALVLQARGSNRDLDVMEALALAGAEAVGVPLNQLRADRKRFKEFQMLILPGGFSYADALGAGKLLALDLSSYFDQEIQAFVDSGRPVIGICNGFQVLVKSGILPFGKGRAGETTLTFNARGHFECRWVTLRRVSQKCIWTRKLDELMDFPIAHGEGNFQVSPGFRLADLIDREQVALSYACSDGTSANGVYPYNPNGSVLDIAGICNPQGNVLGLMPHPENHIHAWQHPQHARGAVRGEGLKLFENGVEYARGM